MQATKVKYSFIFIATTYILSIIFGLIIYPALFNTILFSSVSVLFYRGIILAFVCALIQAALVLLFRKLKNLKSLIHVKDLICIASLTFAINITILIVFPVTIDRSISTFLLSTLASNPELGLTNVELEDKFTNEYLKRQGAINRRMKEQILTGNVAQVGDHFILTPQGHSFVRLFSIINKLYGLEKPSLAPQAE